MYSLFENIFTTILRNDLSGSNMLFNMPPFNICAVLPLLVSCIVFFLTGG
jgi:hypothetical protein